MTKHNEHLLGILKKLAHPRVLLIGDLILDEYIEGEIQRISREAPVPIVEEKRRHYKPGGAANTLANLVTLGAETTAIGVVGKDLSGKALVELLNECGINTVGVVETHEVPTTTKTRISAQSRQSVMQQVLRLDQIPDKTLSQDLHLALQQQLQILVPQADLVIISDYGRGVVVPETIDVVRQLAKTHHKMWVVDSQEDLRLFAGATVLTPNKPEAENNLGYRMDTETELRAGGEKLLAECGAEALLITRGDEGMSLFQSEGRYHQVSALNKADVFDVTGAGDTVVATLSVALGSGCSLPEAMELANLAASIVIRRHGCSTTTPAEMTETLLETKDS